MKNRLLFLLLLTLGSCAVQQKAMLLETINNSVKEIEAKNDWIVEEIHAEYFRDKPDGTQFIGTESFEEWYSPIDSALVKYEENDYGENKYSVFYYQNQSPLYILIQDDQQGKKQEIYFIEGQKPFEIGDHIEDTASLVTYAKSLSLKKIPAVVIHDTSRLEEEFTYDMEREMDQWMDRIAAAGILNTIQVDGISNCYTIEDVNGNENGGCTEEQFFYDDTTKQLVIYAWADCFEDLRITAFYHNDTIVLVHDTCDGLQQTKWYIYQDTLRRRRGFEREFNSSYLTFILEKRKTTYQE